MGRKKPVSKITPTDVRRALARQLRYLHFNQVLADHPTRSQINAISAMLEWLELNMDCAWLVGGRGPRERLSRDALSHPAPHTHLVMDDRTFERARAALKKRRRAPSRRRKTGA